MDNKLIKDILEMAVYAPSGENSQPWRFEVKENIIYQYNIPDRDNYIYNYRQRGSYFAHGAVLQNIILLSETSGYEASIDLFPSSSDTNLVAKISLKESEKKVSHLCDFIKKRATNRKKYKDITITIAQKEELKNIANEFEGISLLFVESKENKEKLSKVFSNNDRIMLENKILHDLIFDNICWTETQEKENKTGLYVKTMELETPQLAIFKLLKTWRIAQLFKILGMTKFIAKENAKIYATGTFYLSILVDDKDSNYVKAGMLVQKLWLTITKWGLSAHPLAALPYLHDRVKNNDLKSFSFEHINLINDSYHILENIYKISDNKNVAMTLRVGDGGEPTALSSRMKPEIIFN